MKLKSIIKEEIMNMMEGYEDYDFPDIDKEEIEREKEWGNLYYGRNVIWIGQEGRMIRVKEEQYYPIWGNIFYPQKIENVVDKINYSPERVYFYAPYGLVSQIGLADIKEAQQSSEEDLGHRQWSTGDDELDEYLRDRKEFIENNYSDEDEKEAEMKLNERLREVEEYEEGDCGEWVVQVRDGNHRVKGAFESGESYVYVMVANNQYKSNKGNPKFMEQLI